MRATFLALRFAVAAAVIAAIIAQLDSSIAFVDRAGTGDTAAVLTNFFSYFTIDSNVLTAFLLIVGGVLLVHGEHEPGWFTTIRAAVTTYMVITGIVYNLLLRAESLPQGVTVVWSNEILHVIAPTYVLLDWLLAPGRNATRQRDVLYVLVFPIIWVVYTLLRGPTAVDPFKGETYWYPYPFINPVTSSYGSVSIYIVGIAVTFVAVASLLAWVSRRTTPPVPSRR